MIVGGHKFLHFYLSPSSFSPFRVPPTLDSPAQVIHVENSSIHTFSMFSF